MPAWTAAEHRQVQRATKDARNAAARAGRAEPPRIVRVQDGDRQLLIAVSRSAPLVGYLLRLGEDGRLTCTCAGFRWRHDCQHVQAGAALLGTTPLPSADVDHAAP